jgi:hypothetical protein
MQVSRNTYRILVKSPARGLLDVATLRGEDLSSTKRNAGSAFRSIRYIRYFREREDVLGHLVHTRQRRYMGLASEVSMFSYEELF